MKSWILLVVGVALMLLGLTGCPPAKADHCCDVGVAVQAPGVAVQVPTLAAPATRPVLARTRVVWRAPVLVSTSAPATCTLAIAVAAPATCAPRACDGDCNNCPHAGVVVQHGVYGAVHGPIFDRTRPFFQRGPARRVISAPVRFFHNRRPIRTFIHNRRARGLFGCGGCG
jgi:hypothetical protein